MGIEVERQLCGKCEIIYALFGSLASTPMLRTEFELLLFAL